MIERVPKNAEGPPEKESKEKLVINKVYQFTHPDFDISRRFGYSEGKARHQELRRLWGKKIDEIANNPRAMLFYVSTFTVDNFQELAKARRSGVLDEYGKVVARDLDRILEIKRKLGRRLILLTPAKVGRFNTLEREHKRMEHLLETNGLSLGDRENLTIHCFGEYLGNACVEGEARNLAQILGVPLEIPKDNNEPYIKPIPQLSLSVEDAGKLRSL